MDHFERSDHRKSGFVQMCEDTSILEKQMRYFIFYPPTRSIRLIDIGENLRVQDVLKLVQKEFGLKIYGTGPSESSIVLSYNGFDLKPKWSLSELSIPSGAIIRCTYKEQKAPDFYIYCGFNKQILKLFDSSITIESTISTMRKKISEKLGLPLSTFCLETYSARRRLYDPMKLMDYDIKMHDRLYLKVWKGYEKFISSCIRGYSEPYSHDDLTRYYQAQVTLYIAAFYGHMELASSVMQYGARSDRPVGEHPSRQWSLETTTNNLPEALKCPIHIAIERAHVKMVDLFVRQSILCTQIRDPVTGYLPYELAMLCSLRAQSKEEKQCLKEIHFYLHDKQYNLRIPLNATGEYVSNLLTFTTINNTVPRGSTHHVHVSLPFYCKLISWYERARERAWKKYGGRFYTITQTKRVYPKQGLLGYKVLIDGYNNTFEAPSEQLSNIRSNGRPRSDRVCHYVDDDHAEREKIFQLKTLMKQFVSDERQSARHRTVTHLQQSRRPSLLHQRSPVTTTAQVLEDHSLSSEYSNSRIVSSVLATDTKVFKSMSDVDHSSSTNRLPTVLPNPPRKENSHQSKKKPKQNSKTYQKAPIITIVNEDNKRTKSSIASGRTHSTLTNNIETVPNGNKQGFQSIMSSVDAFLLSSSRLALEAEQHKIAKRRELLTQIEHTLQQQPKPQPSAVSTTHSSNPLSDSLSADHGSSLDVDSYLPLPDHPVHMRSGPFKTRSDLNLRYSAFQPYERYASASLRSTAINCLQEASYFKRKTWLKKVEMSQEMVKHKAQRRMCRADEKRMTISPTLLLRPPRITTSYKTNTLKVN